MLSIQSNIMIKKLMVAYNKFGNAKICGVFRKWDNMKSKFNRYIFQLSEK